MSPVMSIPFAMAHKPDLQESSDYAAFLVCGGRCHAESSDYAAFLVCGGRCHAECEARHLDPVEQTRFQSDSKFVYPKKPRLMITASPDMGPTASTWAFNAVRLLFRQAGEACDSYWIRRLPKEKLQARKASKANVLVKTHELEISAEELKELLPMFTHVLVSVRKGHQSDPDWEKLASLAVRFEQVVVDEDKEGKTGSLTVLRSIASHLGLQGLSDFDLRVIDNELMTLPIPPMGSDPISKLWHHQRRGGRQRPERPKRARTEEQTISLQEAEAASDAASVHPSSEAAAAAEGT
eukprot:g8720.t1